MTVHSPPVVVPAIPPQPPQLSLLGSAVKPRSGADPSGSIFEIDGKQLAALPGEVRAELEARRGESWVRGFAYAPESHQAAEVRDGCDFTDDGLGPAYSNLPINTVVPYLIVASDTCSAFGFEERDFKGRAARRLENAKYQAIEREFWAGTLAQAKSYPNRYLADSNAVDLTPGTVPSVARALQILQDALAGCGFGGQGMIHVQPQTAPNLLGARRQGNLLLDIFDNIVVPGVGYPGTGPVGNLNATPPAGQAWMYATDLVMVREESEPTVIPDSFAEALKRSDNTITFRAMKFAAAFFDGACQFAVRATLAS